MGRPQMTAPTDIPALRQQLTDAGLTHGPMHDALNELERTRAERKSYEELYADALADAKSDAQDFESDLWIEVRKFLTEINLDWRDYAEDGILAEQAVEYIRECMDEETRRAETAEAVRDRLAGELGRMRAALQNIVDSYEATSELHTSSAECAANLHDFARAALKGATP